MIDIGQIIKTNSIKIFFQMILLPIDSCTFSLESFVRGIDPTTHEHIPPGKLFLSALKADMSEELERICICKTLENFKPFAEQNENIMLHINVNRTFYKASIDSNYIENCAKKYQISSHRIVIDIHNLSVERENLLLIKQFISFHRKKGFYISIDDIGKNYSNIDKIMLFNPDIIKLNQQMLKDLTYSDYTHLMIEHITTIAHRMGILVIATGIESKEDLEKALHAGVQMIQGYYISPAAELDYSEICHIVKQFDYSSVSEITTAQFEKDEKNAIINFVNFNSHIKTIFENIKNKDFHTVMKDILISYPFIESSYFINESGIQISDSFINKSSFGNRNKELFGLYPKGFSHANMEYFTQLLNPLLTDWVTKPFRSRLSNDICVTTSFKINHTSDTPIYAVLNYNYQLFKPYIATQKPKINLFEEQI